MTSGLPKVVLALAGGTGGLPALVRAGPLLFTGGCDGHRDPASGAIVPALAGQVEEQCEIAYGGLERLLSQAGAGPGSIVRLDHVTSSQDWLPRRQTIRQKHFGRPAPLASTGVAARMQGINMLTAAAVSVMDPADKAVLVPGPRYGMHNISALVRGGPFLFVSGIRGTVDPRDGRALPEETPASFAAQVRLAYEIIVAILAEAGAGADRILRLDCYVRDIQRAAEERAIRSDVLSGEGAAGTVVALPLGARGEVEVTALALAPGQGDRVVHAVADAARPGVVGAAGFLFVGDCRATPAAAADRAGQLDGALRALDDALRRAGSNLSRVVRLDLYLRDVNFAAHARDRLRQRFGERAPALFLAGADLDDLLEVKLAAIALSGD